MDHYIASGGSTTSILYLFKNTYPRNITIIDTTITNLDTDYSADNPNIIVMPGRTYVAHFTLPTTFNEDQKETLRFTITYKRSDSSTEHNITGTSIGIVQALDAGDPEPYCGDGTVQPALGETCEPTHYAPTPTGTAQCGGKICRSDCTCVT